jgi:hypothetical protein
MRQKPHPLFITKSKKEHMIKHIVLWTFKSSADSRQKQENLLIAKEKLEAMGGKIPGLQKIEVGISFQSNNGAWDLALYSEFESKEALQEYQVHPEHLKCVGFLRNVRDQRAVVDYEQ